MEALLLQAQFLLAGHLVRMPDNRIPKQIFYGQLESGMRLPGGPVRRYKDTLKINLKRCGINPNLLNSAALWAMDRRWNKNVVPVIIIIIIIKDCWSLLHRVDRRQRQMCIRDSHRNCACKRNASMPEILQVCSTSTLVVRSCHLIPTIFRRQRRWNWSSLRTWCR